MASYAVKSTIGGELDKVISDLWGDDKDEEETPQERPTISTKDRIAEEKRRAAEDKERKEKQAKAQQEREEVRQKIRDKYNLKKDEPSTSAQAKTKTTTTLNENKAQEVYQASSVENQGFDPKKMTTNAFNSLKKKFGWK